MIVYFLRKSKVGQWSGLVVLSLVGIYAVFVFSEVLKGDSETIQIVRAKLVQNSAVQKVPSAGPPAGPVTGEEYTFVASKRGKYYYPKSCSKAKALSIQNMLYFKDKMAAEAAGFMPNSGC